MRGSRPASLAYACRYACTSAPVGYLGWEASLAHGYPGISKCHLRTCRRGSGADAECAACRSCGHPTSSPPPAAAAAAAGRPAKPAASPAGGSLRSCSATRRRCLLTSQIWSQSSLQSHFQREPKHGVCDRLGAEGLPRPADDTAELALAPQWGRPTCCLELRSGLKPCHAASNHSKGAGCHGAACEAAAG